MEEIVVTASKRQQNINDVALTVTALSGDAIRNRQVTNLDEFATKATLPDCRMQTNATLEGLESNILVRAEHTYKV